jgi:hypothetical protein
VAGGVVAEGALASSVFLHPLTAIMAIAATISVCLNNIFSPLEGAACQTATIKK